MGSFRSDLCLCLILVGVWIASHGWFWFSLCLCQLYVGVWIASHGWFWFKPVFVSDIGRCMGQFL